MTLGKGVVQGYRHQEQHWCLEKPSTESLLVIVLFAELDKTVFNLPNSLR